MQELALCMRGYISVATRLRHPNHPGQPGHVLPRLTGPDMLIKYLSLTRILHRITCVNNDVSWWRCLGWCEHNMSIHFEKSHCWWHGSTEKSNKIALWVQVACTAIALAALCSQTIWRSRRLSMFHHIRTYTRNNDKHQARHMSWVRETIPCIQD